MQTDLFGQDRTISADWRFSDQNLIFVSLAGDGLRPQVHGRGGALCRQLGLDGLRLERVLHVTVSHFGHYGHIPEAIAEARAIGKAMVVRRSQIILDRYGSFSNPQNDNPFVLSASETPDALKLLNKELAKRVRRLGLECPSGINPHVTLRYGPELVPFSELAPSIVWPLDELVLIMSRRGAQEHIIIDRWPAVGS